ncbi:MAG: ATP-binding protein [Tissierellia bacterium]|nr:ATP-binding protein [Tissierellia bacterium]
MNSSGVNAKLREIREKNLRIQDVRTKEVYDRIPRIKEIDGEFKLIGLKLAKSILESRNLIPQLKRESEELQKEKRELLESHGYPADYLELKYDCEICKDTGSVNSRNCQCKKRLLAEKLYSMSGIERIIELENFDNFDLKLFRSNRNESERASPREMMAIYKDDAMRYVENFSKLKRRNRFYYGPVGTGKTYLCNSIAKGLLDRNYTVIYQISSKLINFITDYNFARAENKLDMKMKYDMLLNCDLLIIDDLGTEVSSPINTAHLFEIINDRIISDKATIISTNLNVKDIKTHYDDRIFSRILGEYDLYNIFGDDLRIKKFTGI